MTRPSRPLRWLLFWLAALSAGPKPPEATTRRAAEAPARPGGQGPGLRFCRQPEGPRAPARDDAGDPRPAMVACDDDRDDAAPLDLDARRQHGVAALAFVPPQSSRPGRLRAADPGPSPPPPHLRC